MREPVPIGITTSLTEGEQRLDLRYVRAVEQAGGHPWILPFVDSADAASYYADRLDGLLIPGGPAVEVGLVGTLPPDLPPTDPLRVRSDRLLLGAFLERAKPVFGICYGMQLLNAHFGGSIWADVERQHTDALPHGEKRGGRSHPIQAEGRGPVARILGALNHAVNTRHIQAVRSPGEGLQVAARAPDGIVEALESENGRVFGVQFHPEREPGAVPELFDHFVRCSRRVAEQR